MTLGWRLSTEFRGPGRGASTMQYMVIETFKPGKVDAVYERFRARGRMLPAGLEFVDSWLTADRARCYQLMETSDPGLFPTWMERWSDLVDFEVIELIESPTKSPRNGDRRGR
jgi:hypothetical protein